jgi:hypothetical protein
LLCKHEALSSNPKNKKKKKGQLSNQGRIRKSPFGQHHNLTELGKNHYLVPNLNCLRTADVFPKDLPIKISDQFIVRLN